MQTKLIAALSGTALAAAGLTALVLGPAPAADVDGGAAVAQAEPAQGAPGAVKQGIAVKGHWQIEVRNPDGSVAQRREFDNAFVGAAAMQDIFRGRTSVGGMQIVFGVDGYPVVSSANPCWTTTFGGFHTFCLIEEPESFDGGLGNQETEPVSRNLVVTETVTGLRLSGSKIISGQNPTTINAVYTAYASCQATDTPQDCATGRLYPGTSILTKHVFAAGDAIAVIPQQQVVVSVELQFVNAP